MNQRGQHIRPGLSPTQDSVTGDVRKGLSSSQVAPYPSYHDVLILCSLPMSFKDLLQRAPSRADSGLHQDMAGRRGKETPACSSTAWEVSSSQAECPRLPQQTSSFLWGRCSHQQAGVCCGEAEGKAPRPPCRKLFHLM